jgi:hypothetical protein
MVKKMLKAFVNKVKSNVVAARDVFFRVKTRQEDFNYLPINSRMPADRVPVPVKSCENIGRLKVIRTVYGVRT